MLRWNQVLLGVNDHNSSYVMVLVKVGIMLLE